MPSSSAIPLLPATPGVGPVAGPGAGADKAPGLFGALVAGGGGAGGDGAASMAPDDVLGASVEVANPNVAEAQSLQVQQPVLLGGQVQVQGTIQAVQQLAVQVQVLYQSLVETGTLTVGQFANGSDLTAALIQQGMAPEDAAAYAQRVATMLDVLEAQGLVQDGQAGELAMTLLASLLQGAQQPAWQTMPLLVQVQHTNTVQSFGIVAQQGRWPGQHPTLHGLDLARAVLGNAGGPMLTSDAQPEFVTLPTEARIHVQTVPTNGATDDAGAAAVLLALPANKTALTGGLGTGAGVVQPVALEALVQAPSGVEQFRWQREGEQEVLKALSLTEGRKEDPAVLKVDVKSLDGTPLLQTPVAAALLPQGLTVAGGPGLDHATLSARLEQAQQARVAQQLTLQFQPLADNGGGKVRMTLNPPELGRIDVELTIRNGEVQGRVAATDPAVLEHLVRELPTLRQGLADAGLRVNEQGLSLLLSDGGNGQQAGQQFGQHAGQGARTTGNRWLGGDEAVDGDAITAAASHWVAPERLMDVRI